MKKLVLSSLIALAGIAAMAPITAAAAPHRHKVCNWDRHHHHRMCHWVR